MFGAERRGSFSRAMTCEYVYIDLMDEDEQQNVLEELAQYNPDCTVPTLVVGDEVIVGYEPERIRNALKLK